MTPPLVSFSPQLHLLKLELGPSFPGFRDFLGAWLYRDGESCLIDPGPDVCVPALLEGLAALQVERLDFILLTHIHIDHAGGVGRLLESFPAARVVCHPGAWEHLLDPRRLEEASVRTLGPVGRAYGPIKPVPMQALLEPDKLPARIQSHATPGHAPHHLSYQVGDLLFAGEAGGVCLGLGATGGQSKASAKAVPGAPQEYLRPATPPRFLFEVYAESLQRLIALKPGRICYGHFGLHEQGGLLLERHRRQIELWKGVVSEEHRKSSGSAPAPVCLKRLLREDAEISAFDLLPPDIREREKQFLLNSIKGFLGWLDSREARENTAGG